MRLFNPIWGPGDEVILAHFVGDLDVPGWEPFLPGDPDGKTFEEDAAKEALGEEIRKKAEAIVNFDAARALAEQIKQERSGADDAWAQVDIGDCWDREQQLPAVGTWSDGHGIFYAGKINEVHGPSESGKTMLLLAVAAEEIRAGHHVIMVDYEDDADAVTARMRWVFGLEREETEKHFHYFNPGRPFTDAAFERLNQIPATLCIIDAVTEAMSVSGFDGRNENEVAAWYAEFPKRLAAVGMAVVLVDHTSKNNHEEALGSQHKKSAITGVSYTAKPVAPFTKGHRGELSIRVAKDKLGGIRPHADSTVDGQALRGSLVIDGTHGQTTVELNGVEESVQSAAPAAVTPPVPLPDVTDKQMVFLKALNFYEHRGTSPAGMALHMQDEGYPTSGQNVRNKLVELSKKDLAVQPSPKGAWFITPRGVSVIARELALGESWTARSGRRRVVSQVVSGDQTKLPDETIETDVNGSAKLSLTCDETDVNE